MTSITGLPPRVAVKASRERRDPLRTRSGIMPYGGPWPAHWAKISAPALSVRCCDA
jgi:hypothetical protein